MPFTRCDYCNDGSMIRLTDVVVDGKFVKYTISCHGFSTQVECLKKEWIAHKDKMLLFAASVFYDDFETILKGGVS